MAKDNVDKNEQVGKNVGKIVQIIGPVIDVEFEAGHLPVGPGVLLQIHHVRRREGERSGSQGGGGHLHIPE